jgi:hypothetical protein
VSGGLSGSDRALARMSAEDMGGSGGKSCGVGISKQYLPMPHLSNSGQEEFRGHFIWFVPPIASFALKKNLSKMSEKFQNHIYRYPRSLICVSQSLKVLYLSKSISRYFSSLSFFAFSRSIFN